MASALDLFVECAQSKFEANARVPEVIGYIVNVYLIRISMC